MIWVGIKGGLPAAKDPASALYRAQVDGQWNHQHNTLTQFPIATPLTLSSCRISGVP